MSVTVIDYDPVIGDYPGVFIAEKVTHMSKSTDGELTYIYLEDGTVLDSLDSIRTLAVRMGI